MVSTIDLAKRNFRAFINPIDYIGQAVKYSNWQDAIVTGYDAESGVYTIQVGEKKFQCLGRKLLHRWEQTEIRKYSSNLPSGKIRTAKRGS